MADRKNQHFVPRSVLRPWTLDRAGRAINLYNIRADRGVRNAPAKNQCSRDYFYGADLRIETWLGQSEGIYAKITAGLPISNVPATAERLDVLREFALLQSMRTQRSLAMQAAMIQDMYDIVLNEVFPDETVPTHEQIVREAIENWKLMRPYLRDLKGLVVVNDTDMPFVISDDPAVHTNRLHVQWLGRVNFGLQSAGMIFTMPISPRLAILYYDGDVYCCPDKQGLNLVLRSGHDAQAFNELQFIKAGENIYFADWNQLEAVRSGFAVVADRRISLDYRFDTWVPVDGKKDTFVPTGDPMAKPEGQSILHLQNVSFRPRSWPAPLRYRDGMHGYDNGSASGYLRRRWAAETGLANWKKVKFS